MDKNNHNSVIAKAGKWFGIVLLIIIPLVFTPFSLDAALMPRTFVWIVSLIAFLIIGYRLSKRMEHKPDFSIFRRLIFPLLISYFIITGVSFFSASNKIEAINEILRIIPFIVFTGLAAFYFSNFKESISYITKLVIVFALIQSVIGIVQILLVLYNIELSHEVTYYITGLSAHRNLYSQVLLFSFPFSIYGITIFKRVWRFLAIIVSVILLLLIVMLLVKSVWIAFLLSLVLCFLFFINYFSHFGYKIRIFRRIALYIIGIVAVGVISVFVYAKLDSWETINKQADWIKNYRFGSSLERLDLWEKSVDIYRDNPLKGIGAGNWEIILPSYGTDGLRSEKGIVNFMRPHNDFVGMLAETGIFGFLIYLSFFIVLLYYSYRIVKSSTSKENKSLILIMMGGLLSYMAISSLSYPKERVEHSIFLGIYAIVITLVYHKVFPVEKGKSLKNSRVLFFSVLGLLVLSLISSYYRSVSEYHLRKAFDHRESSEWQGLIDESEKAKNFFSVMDNTGVPISWYTGSGYFQLGKISEAFNEFKDAFKQHPYNIHVLNNLAGCYGLNGDHNRSIELYNKALEISSGFEDAQINLTAVYFNLGDIDQSYNTLRTIDFESLDPRYDKSIKLVLKQKMDRLEISEEDGDMKSSLERIYNDAGWIKKVFGQSLEKGIDFDIQVCDEAIYLMEIMDKSITLKRAVLLKEKYL